MKKKMLGIILVCALSIACLAGCGNNNAAPEGAGSATNEGSGTEESAGAEEGNGTEEDAASATITVEVVHADQSTKEFTYTTDAEMLGEVLLAEELVVGEETEYGLMISEVDGEQAIYEVDNAYWSLTINGEYAQTGVDTTPVEDGTTYALVYTPAEEY
ncbi:MAG: DUF4430 domain-containing protein [Eubacterium sp.]|nr:DUF4430 domain-containing protein [Eubacterium sp.]